MTNEKVFSVSHHGSHDWCHICGERSYRHADIWYPENAEHALIDKKPQRPRYLRICNSCAVLIAHFTENEHQPFEVVRVDLLNPPSNMMLAAGYLESAARILQNHRKSRLESVSWRVADAGLLLRGVIERIDKDDMEKYGMEAGNVQGVDIPTGMGAMLPAKVTRSKSNGT